MAGQRAAPVSARAQSSVRFLSPLPLPLDENCHLTPTDSRRLATAHRPPDVTLKLSADAEGEPHFAEARCARRGLLLPNFNQTATFRLRLGASGGL
jgi:hypothetical protein